MDPLIFTRFPLRAVSEACVREWSRPVRPVFSLHPWPARRPLSVSRAMAAALLPDDPRRRPALLQAVAGAAHGVRPAGMPPLRLLDPFAGGGSIPLAGLEMGMEVAALDYSPIAAMILHGTLEAPQRVRSGPIPMPPGLTDGKWLRAEPPLQAAVQRWGEWMLDRMAVELAPLYPYPDPPPIGVVWGRAITCPFCGAEVPLVRYTALKAADGRIVAAYRLQPGPGGRAAVEILEGDIPKEMCAGTMSADGARCPACGGRIGKEVVREALAARRFRDRPLVEIYREAGRGTGHRFQAAADLEIPPPAGGPDAEWLDRPIPNWPFIQPFPAMGIRRWGDLFNARQKHIAVSAIRAAREAIHRMREMGAGEEAIRSIAVYLAFLVSRIVASNTVLNRLDPQHVWTVPLREMGNQRTLWGHLELNPFPVEIRGRRSLRLILRGLEELLRIPCAPTPPEVRWGSATRLPWPDGSFDAVITDIPYGHMVSPYSHLSAVFYPLMRRILGDLFPYFDSEAPPGEEEVVANLDRHPSIYRAYQIFEDLLTAALSEIRRVLRPGGVAVIAYANIHTVGWRSVTAAIRRSGLRLLAAWPVVTEKPYRGVLTTHVSMNSSLWLVCRRG